MQGRNAPGSMATRLLGSAVFRQSGSAPKRRVLDKTEGRLVMSQFSELPGRAFFCAARLEWRAEQCPNYSPVKWSSVPATRMAT